MSTVAIRAENVGKRYQLHRAGGRPRYRTLREDLLSGPRRLWQAWRTRRADAVDAVWALEDVSFEVKQGEVLGIIGRNGAGKSTLLKIISRIVEPTTGAIDLHGRVGSLLEVGTGFHPELTGRENIFLSGAMLGMRRSEVRTRLDEIVAFAGVERFLDTACKHYSSGMYARLGFAVAAHLTADILLVDEVLAVGDLEFQKRCLGKMTEVAGSGRTVLFVSHNLAAVRQLCSRGLALERGRLALCSDVDSAISWYQAQFSIDGLATYRRDGPAAGPSWIAAARITGFDGRTSGCIGMNDELEMEVEVSSREARRLALSLQLREFGQSPVFHCPSADVGQVIPVESGVHRVRIVVPPVFLYPGTYGLRLTLTEAGGGAYDVVDIVEELSVTIEQDAAVCARPLSRQAGLIFVRPRWEYRGKEQG